MNDFWQEKYERFIADADHDLSQSHLRNFMQCLDRDALTAIRAAGQEPRIFENLKTPPSRGAIAASYAYAR